MRKNNISLGKNIVLLDKFNVLMLKQHAYKLNKPNKLPQNNLNHNNFKT